MTVIFQLFCVDDLKHLLPDKLEAFQEAVRNAVQRHPLRAPGVQDDVDPQIRPRRGAPTDPSPNPPPQISDALTQRMNEVSQQLKSPAVPSPSGPLALYQAPAPFNFAQLAAQHFGQQTPDEEQERKILQWAISCEVNNYKFYYPLLRIRDEVYDWFFEATGQWPKGPDSRYSPFHPQHPLYNLLQQLQQRRQPPPSGTSTPLGP
jgi:hypothetical protein